MCTRLLEFKLDTSVGPEAIQQKFWDSPKPVGTLQVTAELCGGVEDLESYQEEVSRVFQVQTDYDLVWRESFALVQCAKKKWHLS